MANYVLNRFRDEKRNEISSVPIIAAPGEVDSFVIKTSKKGWLLFTYSAIKHVQQGDMESIGQHFVKITFATS